MLTELYHCPYCGKMGDFVLPAVTLVQAEWQGTCKVQVINIFPALNYTCVIQNSAAGLAW